MPSSGSPRDAVKPSFARKASPKHVYPTESVALLDGGAEAYPRMLEVIGNAERSIYLEVYAFTAVGIGARFIEALSEAARRGVTVHVRLDGWGSVHDGAIVAAALRKAGCEVRIYNRVISALVGRLGRNHRKILLVDDAIAFLGGINIGDENIDRTPEQPAWADLALEIHGPQCKGLGQRFRHEYHRPIQTSLRIYVSGIGGGFRLRRRYIRAFARARHRIDIAHGYFLPDRDVIRAIVGARKRGVEVRLLLPGRSDVPFAVAATRSLYAQLLDAGVRIHEWTPSILHAKVATVDSRILLVGSFNLDPLSLANMEALVEVSDEHVARQGETWIQDHFDRGQPMSTTEANARLKRWVFDPLGRTAFRVTAAISRIIAAPHGKRQARR